MKISRILQLLATVILGLYPTTGHSQIYYYSAPVGGFVGVDLAPGNGFGGFQANFGTLTAILYYDPVAQTIQEVGSVTVNPSSGYFSILDSDRNVVGSATLTVGTNGSFSFGYSGNAPFIGWELGVPVSGSGVYNGQPFSGTWSMEIPVSTDISAVSPTSLTYVDSLDGQNPFGVTGGTDGLYDGNYYGNEHGFGYLGNWGYSAVATVLSGPASISNQPQSVVVNAYDNTTFTVTAAGTAPLSYQWSLNGSNISGATTMSLTIPNVVQANLGTYAVVVSNALGSVASSNATLSMYPFIETSFTGAVTYWGKDATLSMEAWGTGPLSYQWFQNGVSIPNGTNQTLILTSIQFTNAGLYSVIVSSALGSATNAPAQVIVEPAGVSLGGLYPSVIISGVVGYNYIIESTADLSNTNSWITVTNLTLTQPIQLWVDTNTDASLPANPHRFYQVLPGQ